MDADATAIESSTLTVAWARKLAEHCRTAGIDFLDAPVSGSLPQAEAAQLIYLVGGDRTVVERVEPVLSAMGRVVHHAGPSGAGAALKLMVNGLLGVQVTALAELIALMKRLGVDEKRAVEILTSTPVCSPAAKFNAEAMLAGRFDPLFSVELVEKDLRYALQAANNENGSVPLSDAARAVFREAIDRGLGELNITAVVKLYDHSS